MKFPSPVSSPAEPAAAAPASVPAAPAPPVSLLDPAPPAPSATAPALTDPAPTPTPPVEPAAVPPVEPTEPAAPVAVEPFVVTDIQLPEGTEISPGNMESFVGFMNDAALSPLERAQKLVDLQVQMGQEAQTASETFWNTTQDTWREEVRALPEIGGVNTDKTLADIKAGLNKVGATTETYAALSMTGAGNHPEIIKVLHKLTAPLVEGSPPAAGLPRGGDLSQAERMFKTKE